LARTTFDRPIVIVGAGRSGTRLLRRVLTAGPDVACLPLEVNSIWRHGNVSYPYDDLKPHHARPAVVRYIRRAFARFVQQSGGRRLVEKTAANALRVGFVHAVLPEALVLHIVRDGRAVAESARRRWRGGPQPRLLGEKARWVPWSDIPRYMLRYLRFQTGLLSARKAQRSWGPRFPGIDELVSHHDLIEVCAIQWRTCVDAAEEALAGLPRAQALTVRYEDLVHDSIGTTRRLYEWGGIAFTAAIERFVRSEIVDHNVGKWRRALSADDLASMSPHVEATLRRHGYH
jgi:hypothetical protein